jgi:pimeloyl-ACP methyl ester carboxylesterase
MSDQARLLRLESGDEVNVVLHANGRARKCLLIHGNPSSSADWAAMMPQLRAVADVAALDLPGFGATPRATRAASDVALTRTADLAVAVANALAWTEPFFVVGHSHGGGVAQVMAARNPERVAGLVLLGSLGYPAQATYRLLSLPGMLLAMSAARRALQSRWFRPIARWALAQSLRSIFWPETAAPARLARELEQISNNPELLVSMVQCAQGSPNASLLAAAARISCPVLFLHGSEDKVVPVACAEAIHRRLVADGRRSRFEVLERAGHLFIEFQAAEIARRTTEFIRECEAVLVADGSSRAEP